MRPRRSLSPCRSCLPRSIKRRERPAPVFGTSTIACAAPASGTAWTFTRRRRSTSCEVRKGNCPTISHCVKAKTNTDASSTSRQDTSRRHARIDLASSESLHFDHGWPRGQSRMPGSRCFCVAGIAMNLKD